MATIYELATARMAPEEIDSHESDLYLKKTEVSEALVAEYQHRDNVTTFVDQIEGILWYDVPFAYDPFWIEKEQRAKNIYQD